MIGNSSGNHMSGVFRKIHECAKLANKGVFFHDINWFRQNILNNSSSC